MAGIDLGVIANNPATLTSIVGSGIRVYGWIMEDFAIGGSNTWDSLYDLSALEGVNKSYQQVVQASSGEAENVMMKSIGDTVAYWGGSSTPEFSLPMMFVALNTGVDVRVFVKDLLKGVYPTNAEGKITVPLGFNSPKSGEKAELKGTVTVQIGKWFKAPGQVLTNANFSFSKEVTPTGTPLYALGSIGFRPYRMITAKEIGSYITS